MMTHSDPYKPEARYTLVNAAKGARTFGPSIGAAGVLAFVLLIGAGVAYQAAARGLQRIRDSLVLPMRLSTIPKQIGSWDGNDVPIASSIVEYMKTNFADDYVNRTYWSTAERASAGMYVVYCSSYPSGLLGHRPDVCFPANGFIHDHTSQTEVTTRSGRTVKCLIQQFHKAFPASGQAVVLSFYVLNGQITLRERDFSGFWGRTPNISGNPARYVAQVQITSISEPVVRLAARDLVDTFLTFLPDQKGQVKGASSSGPIDASQGTGLGR